MHIVVLNYFYDPGFPTAEALLERYRSLTGWAEGLQEAGAKVTVLQRFQQDFRIERGGITYHLVADRYGPRLRPWQVPQRLHRLVQACRPTGVHINGLFFPWPVRSLRAMLPPDCAFVAQHHAEKPGRGWRRWGQRWGLQAVDGFLFAARELAQPWVQQGLIRPDQPVYQVMEGSTGFGPQEQTGARARTGLYGDPVLLWVGRLNQNKDPLTVLAGFEPVLEQMAAARLYLVYSSEELLPQVRTRIEGSPALKRSVELVGRRPYPELEDYYNSADYFVLGSHYEGSGYALAEALACGVVPIVTDIPSFRMMTNGGALGALWPVGDAEALTAAMREILACPRAPLATAARGFFEEHLSFPAIGRRALAAYQELAARRGRKISGCGDGWRSW